MDSGILRYHYRNSIDYDQHINFDKWPMKNRENMLNNNKFWINIRKKIQCGYYRSKWDSRMYAGTGGIYAGTKNAILYAYSIYKSVWNQFFSVEKGRFWGRGRGGNPVVCDDQEVFTFAACKYPNYFTTVQEMYNDQYRVHYYGMLHVFSDMNDTNRTYEIAL